MTFEKAAVRLGGIRSLARTAPLPFGETEITDIEHQWQFQLPTEYRRFLSQNGAVAFNEYVDFTPIRRLPISVSSTGIGHFGMFFGKGSSDDDVYSLLWNIHRYSGRMPPTLIPIGGVGNGSLICLCVVGPEKGKIYYWDHTNEPLDEETYLEDFGEAMSPEAKFQNVHLIADSFEDFLERLSISTRA